MSSAIPTVSAITLPSVWIKSRKFVMDFNMNPSDPPPRLKCQSLGARETRNLYLLPGVNEIRLLSK